MVKRALVSENSNRLISQEDIKSMYYWLNAKPDSEIKILPKHKKVTIADLQELNQRITDKLKNYKVITNITAVNIILSKKRILDFGSWTSFESNNWNHLNNTTKTITITWDFTIKLPGYKLPQRHKLVVRLGSHVRPGELLHLMLDGDTDYELDLATANCICRTDFINPTISQELLNHVEDWHNGLRPAQANPLQKFLTRYDEQISEFFQLLLVASVILVYMGTTLYILQRNIDVNQQIIVAFGFSFLLVLTLVYYLGRILFQNLKNIIRKFKFPPVFFVTKGDIVKIEEDKIDNRKIFIQLGFRMGSTVILTIISTFTTFILDLFIK